MPTGKKSIGLALPRSLTSNELKDLQTILEKWYRALNKMYDDIQDNLTTINIGDGTEIVIGDWIYFGDQNTDGSWRIGREGTDWVGQRRESGVWTPSKGGITA